MNSRDLRVLFLYEWESQHNEAAAVRNINTAFGNGSVNECTIRRWPAKFETGMRVSQMKAAYTQRLSWTMKFYEQQLKKNPGNTVRDYAEELKGGKTDVLSALLLLNLIKAMLIFSCFISD